MERDWPRDAAELVQVETEAAARADTGGDGTLSHGRKLGRATVAIRRSQDGAAAEAQNRRVWGVLERAGRRPRRSWSRGVKAADPKVKRSADRAWSEVIR